MDKKKFYAFNLSQPGANLYPPNQPLFFGEQFFKGLPVISAWFMATKKGKETG